MPGAGLEPARAFESPQDFKSCASAIPPPGQKTIKNKLQTGKFWRRGAESNRRIQVLQTRALPLCYRAKLTININSCLASTNFRKKFIKVGAAPIILNLSIEDWRSADFPSFS